MYGISFHQSKKGENPLQEGKPLTVSLMHIFEEDYKSMLHSLLQYWFPEASENEKV